MNIPSHLSPEESRRFLLRQLATGRYMILGTVIITVVDLILLLTGADFYIFYSAAVAYYAVVLGLSFDAGIIGTFTLTALLLAIVILAVYLLLWQLVKKNILWLKVSIGLLALDTLLLAGLYLYLGSDIADCLWELVIHGAVLWEMGKAVSASGQLAAMPAPEEAPAGV